MENTLNTVSPGEKLPRLFTFDDLENCPTPMSSAKEKSRFAFPMFKSKGSNLRINTNVPTGEKPRISASFKSATSPVLGLYLDSAHLKHRCGRKLDMCKGGCRGHGFGSYHKSSSEVNLVFDYAKSFNTNIDSVNPLKDINDMLATPLFSSWEFKEENLISFSQNNNSSHPVVMEEFAVNQSTNHKSVKMYTQEKAKNSHPPNHHQMFSSPFYDQFLLPQQMAFYATTNNTTTSNNNIAVSQYSEQQQTFPDGLNINYQHRESNNSELCSNSVQKPFPCPYQPKCACSFSRRHDLIRHMRIHTNEKPFRCDRCFKAFTRLDALGRHLKISEKYRGNCRSKRGRVPKTESLE